MNLSMGLENEISLKNVRMLNRVRENFMIEFRKISPIRRGIRLILAIEW
jgi:hypothetical protein